MRNPDKRVIKIMEEQMDVLTNIADKIPLDIKPQFRKISALNDEIILLYNKKEKNVFNENNM